MGLHLLNNELDLYNVPHHSNLCIGVADVDGRGWFEDCAGDDVGQREVSQEEMVCRGREVRHRLGGDNHDVMSDIMNILLSYLERDQEKVIGECAGQGEEHLRDDKEADPSVVTGDLILARVSQVVGMIF